MRSLLGEHYCKQKQNKIQPTMHLILHKDNSNAEKLLIITRLIAQTMARQRNYPPKTPMSLLWSLLLLLLLLLLQLHSILCQTISSSSSNQTALAIAMPHCDDRCGKIRIPYPFGIGANCYHDPQYEIVCNNSFHPPKAFLKCYNLEVTRITWPIPGQTSKYSPLSIYSTAQTLTALLPVTNICGSAGLVVQIKDIGLHGSPYSISSFYNTLWVEGCSGGARLTNRTGQIIAGCATVCTNTEVVTPNAANCYGAGCCLSSISDDNESFDYYEIGLDPAALTGGASNACNLSVALVEYESVDKIAGRLSNLSTAPALLFWTATYLTSTTTRGLKNVICNDLPSHPCMCSFPYEGSPYLPNGCKIVQECQKCRHNCALNETTSQYYCRKNSLPKRASILGFTTGAGFVLLVLSCYWMYKMIKRRMEIKRKYKYFKRNGGLLLQQQISSSDGIVQKMTIFSIADLEKATDNFHQNRILGQGGQGTVYKGMLMDGRIVAVKKSMKIDEGQLDQFINEVVILSQINHRNVVKLLGCCLETEVPLLLYEFIPNGTLYQHLHDPTEDFHLSWKMRLQIAAESAGALAYLHSSSFAPIYHRDIKSSNILLDEKYRAKVSDFGTSRAINIDQTHVTTRVQGTYGYLDPEYFQSNQFTEKSDVYSFGVVLVELITGKKPILPMELGGWKSLVVEFLSQMENFRLFDIVDARIIEEGKEEEFTAAAELARQCLNMNGKQRPTMKEVAVALDRIRSPYSKAQMDHPGKYVITEIDDAGPSTYSGDMFFSSQGSYSSLSIEVQPLKANTNDDW